MKTKFQELMNTARQEFVKANGNTTEIKKQQKVLAAKLALLWGNKKANSQKYKMTVKDIIYLKPLLVKYLDEATPEEMFLLAILYNVITGMHTNLIKKLRNEIRQAVPEIDEKSRNHSVLGG